MYVRKDFLTTWSTSLSYTKLPKGQEKVIRGFNKGEGNLGEQKKKTLGDLEGQTQSATS